MTSGQGDRQEAAATDVRFVAERTGWLAFAARSDSALILGRILKAKSILYPFDQIDIFATGKWQIRSLDKFREVLPVSQHHINERNLLPGVRGEEGAIVSLQQQLSDAPEIRTCAEDCPYRL